MRENFREGQQPIPGSTEVELPEVNIFDLLSSVGNIETKALTLIGMRKGVVYSRSELHREIMTHQGQSGQNKRWVMNPGVPFNYCMKSLCPIGLVTKESMRNDDTAWGYEITSYGLTTGFDFAGFLLRWSYEHPDFSLHQMFGSTQSNTIKDENSEEKKRAPETRYNILKNVINNPGNRIRQADIASAVGERQGTISSHLRTLGKSGVISYEYIQSGEPVVFYKIKDNVPGKEPEQPRHKKTLSVRAYKVLQQETDYLSNEQTEDLLIEEYPEYGERHRESMKSNISSVLSDLVNQGYAERKFFDSEYRSEVILSEEQKEAISSLVNLIDKFQRGDTQTIEEGRVFAQKVLNDPKLFSELMLKAKERSPNANATNKEELEGWIVTILHENPKGNSRLVRRKLEEKYNKKLGDHAVSRYLRALVKQERIEAIKINSRNVYKVVGEGDNTVSSKN